MQAYDKFHDIYYINFVPKTKRFYGTVKIRSKKVSPDKIIKNFVVREQKKLHR